MIKSKLIEYLKTLFSNEIQEIQADLDLIAIDLTNDTKSSAGDKFETAREMANQEISKLQAVLAEKKRFIQLLQSDTFTQISHEIAAGSLTLIDSTWYFFGIPFGKIQFESETVMGIGLTAPFAQTFLRKKINENVVFNQKSQQIINIL